jgi:uncharacterized Rossmann fold enzyme
LEYAASLKLPHLPQCEPHEGTCHIIGAGPSVLEFEDALRYIRSNNTDLVMTLYGAHTWAINCGIVPHIHVVFESDLEDVTHALGGPPHNEVTYYVCSHCDRTIFDQLEGHKCVLWHAECPPQGYHEAIARLFPGEFMVHGGYATFFRSMTIAIILGYRKFELYGMDSSFEESSHLKGYAIADKEPRVVVWAKHPQTEELKQFTSQGGLVFQASEFLRFCKINQSGLKIRINGDGLLRYLHESRYPDQYERNSQ